MWPLPNKFSQKQAADITILSHIELTLFKNSFINRYLFSYNGVIGIALCVPYCLLFAVCFYRVMRACVMLLNRGYMCNLLHAIYLLHAICCRGAKITVQLF